MDEAWRSYRTKRTTPEGEQTYVSLGSVLSLGIVLLRMAVSDQIIVGDCPFCRQRKEDVSRLRGVARGKQLGFWEREILRRSGPSARRGERSERSGGLPLLSELFPERDFRASWQAQASPSKPVLRAAALRLERTGLVSLLNPSREEAERWIETYIGRDWEPHDEVRRRMLLTSFSWRSLLGDELIARYPLAFGQGSTSRIRWDGRLEEARLAADEACREHHSEVAIERSREALTNARRAGARPRR